jgi:hypothetical protein
VAVLGKRSRAAAARTEAVGDDARIPLSIVVVAYDIDRELPRTLASLASSYQRGVTDADYEVIVVDNGSPTPVDPAVFKGLDGRFRLVRIDDASPSPAPAVNRGIREARGDTIGVMVDGARLASPGLVRYAIAGSRLHPRSGVVTLGWYLGADFQRFQLEAGWSKADEDRLLASIDWPSDGYRLYEIATMDESSSGGWFFGVFESNALFLPAAVWDELGGFDERFDTPGGGLVNHDTLKRATLLDDVDWVMLLGEGTFHQLHGGVATNAAPAKHESSMARWVAQYEEIAGRTIERPYLRDPIFVGELPEALRPQLGHEIAAKLNDEQRYLVKPTPPVRFPDADAVDDPMAAEWARLAGDAARRGLNVETTVYGRLARAAAPDAGQVEPILAAFANMGDVRELALERRVRFHVDAGDACERVGQLDAAREHYLAALADDPGNSLAYRGLSRVRMPGPAYHSVLAKVHELLDPTTYLEIGVCEGDSLTLARAPTVAVGVDPEPKIRRPISVECHIYRETSTEFFKHRDVRSLFGGRGPSLVFIDGLHEFTAALEDFWQVEAISDPGTIVVLHDMIPFDEVTQRADRVHDFYTGDVWKMLHCLSEVRPDLSWFTVRTPPSGLTFVSGLDATSTVLRDRYSELVAQFGRLPFDESRETPGEVIDNDWNLVADRLLGSRAAARRSAAEREELELGRVDAPTEAPLVVGTSDEALSRRVRELEDRELVRRAETDELRRAIDHAEAQLRERHSDADVTAAELEALRATKLYRWSRPIRRVVARARRRGDVA